MKKHFIYDGLIGIITGAILDVIYFIIVFIGALQCTRYFCYNAITDSKIVLYIFGLLLLPAQVIGDGMWRIVALTLYYAVAGVIIGVIYRDIRNMRSATSRKGIKALDINRYILLIIGLVILILGYSHLLNENPVFNALIVMFIGYPLSVIGLLVVLYDKIMGR